MIEFREILQAVRVIRIALTIALIYGVWTETGLWTTLAVLGAWATFGAFASLTLNQRARIATLERVVAKANGYEGACDE